MHNILLLLFVSFLLLILVGIDVGWSMILSAWFGIATKTDRAVDTILIPQSHDGWGELLRAGADSAVHSGGRAHEPRRADAATDRLGAAHWSDTCAAALAMSRC